MAILAILSILSLLLVSMSGPAISGIAQANTMRVTSLDAAAQAKVHPALRRQLADAPESMVMVHAYALAGTDLSPYLSNVIARGYVDPRGYTGYTGRIKARNLSKLASVPEVELVLPMGGAFAPAIDPTAGSGGSAVPNADVQAKMRSAIASRAANYTANMNPTTMEPNGWADVLNTHHSALAWEKGYTGAGVKAMVNDSGIDFAHPDLQGTQARVTDPSSPYYGWPEQFDQFGQLQLAYDYFLGFTNLADGNAGGFADTSAVVTEADSSYQPQDADDAHDYTLSGTSQSGEYHIGTHPDYSLTQWYRIVNGIDLGDPDADDERPAILVVDEGQAGVYDTVYVDLNFNFDFTDDKAARKGDEIVGADWWGAYDPDLGDFAPEPDGFYDQSGGMIYYVADGVNPVPGIDWYWGIGAAGNGAADDGEFAAGTLVGFSMSHWWTSPAADHGQLVASNIAAQGRTNADSFQALFGDPVGGIVPDYKPEDTLGMVTAAGRDAKLVDAGDFYSVGYVDAFAFAALGYDGVAGTEDDVQFINNSWGGPAVDAGWDGFSRLVDFYQRALNPTLLAANSTGNDGPGYGTVSTPGTQSGLDVGASTQYGSTGWDSASSADQLVFNDITAFSSRGPDRIGGAGVDVLASGSRASGAAPLNEAFAGPHAWYTWGGTSRAAPVAVGNATLVYQAYREATGHWPHQDTARAILKSGAQDLGYDPFLQGSGAVDGNRSVDIAAGIAGFYVTPDEWRAGSFNGETYDNFTHVLRPGEVSSADLTVYNTTDQDVRVSVTDRWLQHTDQWEQQWTSSPVSEEDLVLGDSPAATSYDWNMPHYLWNITDQIPEDADVLTFRHNYSLDQFDPDGSYDYTQTSDWYVMAYNWKDVNGDGNLWEDLNGNGTVNAGEIDQGEYVRYDYANQRFNSGFISLRNPLDNIHDGFFIALVHNQARADIQQTDMLLTVDFYTQVDMPWLSLRSSEVFVAAGGDNRVRATVTVPGDAPVGIYQGAVEFSDGWWTSTVPVTINVAGRDFNMQTSAEVGNSIYQNTAVYGASDWRGGSSAGDWRMYFANLPDNPASLRRLPDGQQYWLLDVAWEGLPTDINANILSPALDEWSADFPWIYGPYTLVQTGGSNEGEVADGTYLVQTSSGTSREVIAAPYVPGLNEVVLRQVQFAGADTMESLEMRAGALAVGVSPIEASVPSSSANRTIQESVISTMSLSSLVADGFGLSKPDIQTGVPIQQDDPDDPSTASYFQELTLEHAGLLDIVVDGSDRDDLDLFVLYDFNGDGELTFDEQIGRSTTSSADERVTITLPSDGLYGIAVHGWAVPGGASTFDLSVNAVQGYDITVSGLPDGSVEPGRVYNFDVNIAGEGYEPGVYTGIVTLGPQEGPSAVIVFVEYEIRE